MSRILCFDTWHRELLLRYGARPDARDVCGKTVCHYGAGAMATEMTMDVVERAASAYHSSYFFGKKVILKGLDDETMNGKEGIARGYEWSSKCRLVYLLDDDKQISVKPENIELVDQNDGTNKMDQRNLCNIQCRLGVVSLQETIIGDREDVAKFLIHKLDAAIDIADWDGFSPKSLCMTSLTEIYSPAATIIKDAATKQGKVAIKAARHKCAKCGKAEPEDGKKFAACARCKQVRYCSRDCQGESNIILLLSFQ